MEWISVEDRIPDIFAGKFRVRLSSGDELDAFFYQDSIGWIAFYGQKTGHWWNAKGNHERLDGVTHWRENEIDKL
jgi:hypothetical protein